MQKLTRTFVAYDKQGRAHRVDQYTEFRTESDADGLTTAISVVKTLRLTNGDAVNRVKRGEYLVVVTGVILRSTEADAF